MKVLLILGVAASALLASALTVQLPASADFLEPSIENEANHALDRAQAVTSSVPAKAVAAAYLHSVTNGATLTESVLNLVRTQRADGRWFAGTNDVTAVARAFLAAQLDAEP